MYIGHEFQSKFPLSPKKPLKKTLGSIVLVFFSAIILSFGLVRLANDLIEQNFVETHLYVILIFCIIDFIIMFLLMYAYEVWYYKAYYYDLTEDYVIIKKGPLAPQEITIPYDRIQDVYLDQDILDRLFGLYDVHISTATAVSGMRAHIDGVSREAALGLREIILNKIKEKKN